MIWELSWIAGSSGIDTTRAAGARPRTSCGTLNSAADEVALSR